MAREPRHADKVEAWGPKGLPPQQYYCSECSAPLPLGCRSSQCGACFSAANAKLAEK